MSAAKQSEPIETTLQNFCSSFLLIEMTTTSMVMEKQKNVLELRVRNETLNDLIKTILKQIWFIPEEPFDFI